MRPREGVTLRRPLGVDSGCFGFPGFAEAELRKVRCVGRAAYKSKELKWRRRKGGRFSRSRWLRASRSRA